MNERGKQLQGPDSLDAARRPGMQRPEETLSSLLKVTQELNAAADLKPGLTQVAALVKQYVPYETLAVLLLDDLGRELRFAYAEGFEKEVVDHWRFGMGQGVVGIAAETGKTLRVDDVALEPRYLNASGKVRSELAIPLTVKDRTIGVLEVGGPEPGFFSEEDERLLSFLADHLAAAIENARLYQNMREQAHTLSLLHEASRELSSILDRSALLRKVADLVQRHIDYDLFSVLLWNERTQELEPSFSVSREGLDVSFNRTIPLGYGLCGTAAALKQPLRIPNVHLDPRFVSCVSELDVNSELVVPLVFKDQLIGVVDLESARYNAFTQRQQQLLSTLGSALAIALENARLYEKLQAEENKLETDLRTAREVQRQLLPKATPWIPGLQVAVAYQPARYLGGDFYDFLPYGEGRVAIAVGDVSGKGTSAALFGSLAIGTLREYVVGRQLRPARILRDMNRKLGGAGFDRRFVAMAFAVYEADNRRLSIANSGLPYPLLVRGRKVTPIEVGGVPLGLLPDREYSKVVLDLQPGDAVVIASDGIEDTLNERDEEFGSDRLRGTLERLATGSARDIANGLMEATRLFSGGAEPYDDRTILVMKVTGE